MKLIITDDRAEQALRRLLRMVDVLREPRVMLAVAATKDEIAAGRLDEAAQAYADLDRDEIAALWLAPSKGGVWTTAERNRMKNDPEWLALVHAYRGAEWYARNAL